MKVRRSARTILSTFLVLSVFTTLTVWHNKAPNHLSESEKQSLIKQLSLKNPRLLDFMDGMEPQEKTQGLYVIGQSNPDRWPKSLSRACYEDRLASWSMASRLKATESEKLNLIRYRSVEDFLVILKQVEQQAPGTVVSLEFQMYEAIPEPPVVISFRLIFSFMLGITGVRVVRHFNRPYSPLSQT